MIVIPRRTERGSALVIALVFLSLFGLWIATTLGSADTGARLSSTLKAQRPQLYAADGATDQVIQVLRGDSSKGTDGVAGCGLASAADSVLNNVKVHVNCTAAAGSGSVGLGGSSPTLGLLTMATAPEIGFQQKSSAQVRIYGGVYSNSPMTVFGGAGSQVNACPPSYPLGDAGHPCLPQNAYGTLTVIGACDTSKNHIVAEVKNCNASASPLGADPGYQPDLTTFASVTSVPPASLACPGGIATVVNFAPGWYQDVNGLNTLMNNCGSSLFWFQPGTYYFDFPNGSAPWTVPNNVTVVGGEKKWVTPPSPPSSIGIPGACNGDSVNSHAGVQFIFGNEAKLKIDNGHMELCAAVSLLKQEIAIYGVPPAAAVGNLSAQSGCTVKKSYPTTSGSCPFIETNAAHGVFAISGTIYAPTAALDIHMTNASYQIITRGLIARVLVINVTPSSGFTGAFISSPGVGTLTASDREVYLTTCTVQASGDDCAKSTSVTRLRAHVTFHDQPTAGYVTTVKSWSVVR